MIRRWGAVALLAVGLIVVGPALAANASPTTPAAASVTSAGPLAMKACAPAPEPASPLSGLAGHLYAAPATASDADPFRDPGVSIADVYGYDYAWVDYDTGCLPGSSVWANAQTGIANFLMSGAASVAAFTHSLFGLVVTPDFMKPLDDTLTRATAAIKDGFWDPWVTVFLLFVVVGVLIAATRSETASAVTTVGWALLVLVAATFVMSYPVASARAVDSLVQTTVAASARGLGVTDANGAGQGNNAQSAIDSMFDTINRDTFYGNWLEGTLGSSDSAIAIAYGPDLFKASHLTWSEAATVRDDPDAGQAIIQAKKDLWTTTAAAVESADPGAYAQLTGAHGRWDAAGSAVLRVGLMFPFLVISAVFVVIAYVATRVFVPLAPGFAVVGLMYATQGWVIALLRQVGRFVILGPLFFVGALANLLLDTAVLDSNLALALQFVITAAIPIVLFKLLRPGHAIPGARTTRRMMRSGFGTLVTALATRKAVASGVSDAKKSDDGEAGNPRRDPAPYRYAYPKNGPVATGDTLELTSPGRVGALETGVQRHELGAGSADAGPTSRSAPPLARRSVAAAGSQSVVVREREELHATTSSDHGSDNAHGTVAAPPPRVHAAIHPDDGDVDLAAPATNLQAAQVLGRLDDIPADIHEAAATYDSDGNQVFQIWHPPTGAPVGDDDEEAR